MAKKIDRIILDTNLWVSFLLTSNFTTLDQLISQKRVVLLFSEELLDEFVTVTKRPKLRPFFNDSMLASLLVHINSHAEFIDVISKVEVCRDPKDDFLLALAADGSATHLITGDKDLLELKNFNETSILTIRAYIQKTTV